MTKEEKRRIREEEAYRAKVRKQEERKAKRKGPGLLGGLLLMVLALGLYGVTASSFVGARADAETAARAEEEAAKPKVAVSFTSDPLGATLFIGGVPKGQTPLTVQVNKGEVLDYKLVAKEADAEFDQYEPYSGAFLPTKDKALSVWLERTSAEEQRARRRERSSEFFVSAKGTIGTTCQALVLRSLKSPSTAKFPPTLYATGYSYDVDQGTASFVSYVDAQNAFGATIRSSFKCDYERSADEVKLITIR